MKYLFFSIALFFTFNVYAQGPQKFKYQAAIRDEAGEILSDQQISLKVSIIKDETDGEVVYSERHAPTTNSNGLISLEIGSGNIELGVMEDIDWQSGIYFIKTEIDVDGGTNFTVISISQLLSVPYALYSEKAAYAESSGDTIWSKDNSHIYYGYGNVGIGTSFPSASLEITSNASMDGDALLEVKDSTAVGSYLRLKDGSNLNGHFNPVIEGNSIGAGSPDRTGLWLWGRLSEDGIDDRGMGFRVYNSSGGQIENAPLFTWFNQNEEVMRISSDGNIGIGTETPKAKVQVSNGDVYIDDATKGVIMKSPSGQCWRMTVDDSGNPVFNAITCP